MQDKAKDVDSRFNGVLQFFNVEGLPKAVGVYKHVGARSNPPLYGSRLVDLTLSGMLPLNEDGSIAGEDYLAQVEKVIDNIAIAIQGAASHYGNDLTYREALGSITKSKVFLKEKMEGFPVVNNAYERLGVPAVVRAAVAPSDLPLNAQKGVLVEIMAYATIEDKTVH